MAMRLGYQINRTSMQVCIEVNDNLVMMEEYVGCLRYLLHSMQRHLPLIKLILEFNTCVP